jgi:hypothetical protein
MATCGNDNFLFIHVPKTGGMWVTEALQEAGVEVQEEFGRTAEHPLLSELERRGRFTFAFVREPLSWYGSIWRFRNYFHLHKAPGNDQLPYDRFIGLDFPDFIDNVAEHLPGFLSNHYERFVGPREEEIDFIGRYERLEDDVVAALRAVDQDFDEEALRSFPPINVTEPHPGCPQETRLRLMRSESEAYERFYRSELATSSRG